MQFVGTGIRNTDKIDFDLLRDKASNFDLLVSKTIGMGNFAEGLEDFANHFDLKSFQFSAFNADDKKASSRQISDNLMEFYRQNDQDNFLDFLHLENEVFPDSFYLVFACDWKAGDPVRLKKINVQDLKSFFKRNNSWYSWLHNYSAGRSYPDLSLPLIIEITNR